MSVVEISVICGLRIVMISLIFSVGGLVCVNRKVKCTGEVGKKEGIRRESGVLVI